MQGSLTSVMAEVILFDMIRVTTSTVLVRATGTREIRWGLKAKGRRSLMSAEDSSGPADQTLSTNLDRARQLLRRGEYQAALAECRGAANLAPESAQVHNLRGRALHGSGRLEEAIAAYRMAIRFDPTIVEAWDSLSQAESALETVLSGWTSRRPDWAEQLESHLGRAAELLAEGSYGSVILECDRALRLRPESARAHYMGGVAQLELGRPEQATASFSLAVRRDSTLTEAWEGLYRAEVALVEQATGTGQAAEAAGPEQLQSSLDRAYAYLDQSDYRGTFQACHAALSLSPACAEAHNLRGLVFDDLGHPREAAGAYRLAFYYDPGLEDARKNLLEADREIVPPRVPDVFSAAPAAGKGFGIRAAAYVLDTLVSSIVTLLVFVVAAFVVGILLGIFNRPGALDYLERGLVPTWPFVVAGCITSLLYWALFEWLYGATPGKLILGMRVVKRDGGRCTAAAALVRGLLRYLDSFFFCVPALVSMQAPSQQRVGDKLAKTLVVGSHDPIIRERRDWGWFLVAGGLYTAGMLFGHIALWLVLFRAAGRL